MSIWRNNHEITSIYRNNKEIQEVWKYINGSWRMIWTAVSSCFGAGFWQGNKPWSGKDAWKG